MRPLAEVFGFFQVILSGWCRGDVGGNAPSGLIPLDGGSAVDGMWAIGWVSFIYQSTRPHIYY
jgi:hypothetical protein